MKNKPQQKGLLSRVIKDLFKAYPVLVPVTIICILFSAVTATLPAIFLQEVIAVIEKWQPTKDWSAAVLEIAPMILLLADHIPLFCLSILHVGYACPIANFV